MNIYMICTLWTPFQAERDWKKSYREISKFPSNIYSILFENNPPSTRPWLHLYLILVCFIMVLSYYETILARRHFVSSYYETIHARRHFVSSYYETILARQHFVSSYYETILARRHFVFLSELLAFRVLIIDCIKVLKQGQLIAVAYTLHTYWNQFSLGGICKQE